MMGLMAGDHSIQFFERQFERQVHEPDTGLNPFEQAALPHLRGRVLDYGCGMGQLSLAAARTGCSVLALDASAVAVNHLQQVAAAQRLPIEALEADLRQHHVDGEFDSIVCIGLLMFFDCATAEQALAELDAHLRPGGTMVVNLLVEGTTYMDMFDPQSHCLFARDALSRRYAAWQTISSTLSDYPAPGGLNKSFATVIARKPY
jgi:tellurite methyltransferase